LDTGFLDRLLAKPYHEPDGQYAVMAAVAAAIFATTEPKSAQPGMAASPGNGNAAAPAPASNWRNAARVEALRER
jgi:hypothetical protein